MGWSRFLHRARWDAERAKELNDYLAHEIDDNLARGMTPDEATRAAHRKLGNTTLIREDIYQMNTLRLLDALWRDLRYGLRLLRKNPTFSIVAILTLALGTGANAAIFQLVNAVRLRQLPVERPDELLSIGIDRHGNGRAGTAYGRRAIHTQSIWEALNAEQQAFSSLIAWGSARWDLSDEGEARPAQGYYVSGAFFEALGVRAHAGRVLTPADDRKGCGAPGAVLSHGFWQSRYGGNPGVIGQPIMLDRRPFEIVGVTSPRFFGVEVGRTFDVAIPMCAEPMFRPRRGDQAVWWLDIMGRLKPGWTEEGARAHLQGLSPGIFSATVPSTYSPETSQHYRANTFTAKPAAIGVSNLRTDYATPMWVLFGATGLVLLITCANLANLMLARASARDREIGVRLAIGASRGRVVRQLLSESLLIAALGATGGILLAQWLSRLLVTYLTSDASLIFVDLTPDWRVFAFITIVAIAACLVFGLSPALKATRTDPGKTMQTGGRASTDAHEALRMRRGLVVVQVALSMVLVVGAVLFARTLRNLTLVDLGFRTEGVIDVSVDLRRTSMTPDARAQAYQQIVAGVRNVPGVEHASEAYLVPLSGSGWNEQILIGGTVQRELANFNQVGEDYFRTLDMTLIEGRTFGAQDRPGAPLAAVVNRTFARQFFPGGSPIGRTFENQMPPGEPRPTFHIIGVVGDTNYTELREERPPTVFVSWAQEPQPPPFVEILVRSALPLASLRPGLTRAVVQAAPGASVQYDTVSNYAKGLASTERLMASLSVFFGVLAMLIACVGLYGVMSYMVTRRQVEIGLRMALGADPGSVIRMVLRESAVLLAAGLVLGIALAVFVSRYARTMLYGLEPWDPASFAVAALTLGAVSLLAAWFPARRASRLAPTLALRE